MAVFEIPERERIQCGRDAGRSERRVMGKHCGHRRPGDAAAGSELHVEMIGMQFDQAGQQIVTGEIDRIFVFGIGHDAIGQDELRVAQGEVRGGIAGM